MRRYLWIGVAVLALAILASPAVFAGKGNGKGKPGDGGGGGEEPAPTTKRVALTGRQVKGGSDTGLASLHTVGGDGSNLSKVVTSGQWEGVDWSPDGQYIACRASEIVNGSNVDLLRLHHVASGGRLELDSVSLSPSWSCRLDANGAPRASESQYIAGSVNSELRIHRPFGPDGSDAVTLLSLSPTDPSTYVSVGPVEWLPQHPEAGDTSWILFRQETHASAGATLSAKLMMVEVDTGSWPVDIVTGPVEVTWAETAYPPGVSDDGKWACWAAADGSSLRIAPLQWNATTGGFLGIGTPTSFGSSAFSSYDEVVAYGASLNADGSRAAVWAGIRHYIDATRYSTEYELVMLDVNGSNVATVGPSTKKRGVSMYGGKTSWEP